MNKLKNMGIVWTFIILSLLILMVFMGMTVKRKNKPYKELENKLVDITTKYIESITWYPEKDASIKITAKELIDEGIISEDFLAVKDDKCDGYVNITNNGVIDFKGFLKCNKYTTLNYYLKPAK